MTQRNAILVLATGTLMACSASDRGVGVQENAESSGDPIVNGDVLTAPESRLSPAVSIRFKVQGVDAEGSFTATRFGSGILIAPNVVLTAAHVVTVEGPNEQVVAIEVQHANNNVANVATVVGKPIVPQSFVQKGNGRFDGVDLAVLKLSRRMRALSPSSSLHRAVARRRSGEWFISRLTSATPRAVEDRRPHVIVTCSSCLLPPGFLMRPQLNGATLAD